MSKNTDNPNRRERQATEPKIDAVCLLPEPTMLLGTPCTNEGGLELRLAMLQREFGRRFTYGFYVTVQHGLLRIDDVYGPGPRTFTDLSQDERHVYINALRGQLLTVMEGGRSAICLLASYYAQYMRRLDLPFAMPLAGMSRRQRRQWLEAATTQTTDGLLHRLFGRPIIIGGNHGSDKDAINGHAM